MPKIQFSAGVDGNILTRHPIPDILNQYFAIAQAMDIGISILLLNGLLNAKWLSFLVQIF